MYSLYSELSTLEKPKTELPLQFSSGRCNLYLDVGRRGKLDDAHSQNLWRKVIRYARTFGRKAETIELAGLLYCSLFKETSNYCINCPAYRTEATQAIVQPGNIKRLRKSNFKMVNFKEQIERQRRQL